jgi:hypothetical protein
MARTLAGCLALALLLTPVLARADAPPARKAGLWEVTTSREGAPAMRKVQMCLDAASQNKFSAMGHEARKSLKCRKTEGHRSGNVFTLDSVCKVMGSTQTMHTVITFDSEDEYTTEISTHTAPPLKHGRADTKMTQHGRWLGPCGPDMKPGDMMINGRKLHF